MPNGHSDPGDMVRPPQIEIDGKRLFRVDVEERRTAVIYVVADDLAAAKADASVLGHELEEWDDFDTDIGTAPAYIEPRSGQPVWTGGENGDFRYWGEVHG